MKRYTLTIETEERIPALRSVYAEDGTKLHFTLQGTVIHGHTFKVVGSWTWAEEEIEEPKP